MASSLSAHFSASGQAGGLIEALDDLSTTLSNNQLTLTLPEIIVIGEESAGKSSVVERLSMISAFPRHEDLCTRMPMQLKMVHQSEKEMTDFCTTHNLPPSAQSAVRFGFQQAPPDRPQGRARHPPAAASEPVFEPYTCDTSEMEGQARDIMEQIVRDRHGANVGVVEDVLFVEVVGTAVPNLTLIDLPGIVGGFIDGEPDDMMERTRALVSKYLARPHCLVVAVVTATTDRVRNSQALQLIQKHGKADSAVGVLTKADLAHRPKAQLARRLDGTATDLVQLSYGYVAVRNRSTLTQQSLADAAREELPWFQKLLPRQAARGVVGGEALVRRISEMLTSHIRTVWVPSARTQLRTRTSAIRREAAQLGEDTRRRALQFWLERAQPHALRLVQSKLPQALELLEGMLRQHLTEHAKQLDSLCGEWLAGREALERCSSGNRRPSATLVRSFHRSIGPRTLCESIKRLITGAFARELADLAVDPVRSDGTLPCKLSRFPRLHDALSVSVVQTVMGRYTIAERTVNELIRNWYFFQYGGSGGGSGNDAVPAIQLSVEDTILTGVLLPALRLQTPGEFVAAGDPPPPSAADGGRGGVSRCAPLTERSDSELRKLFRDDGDTPKRQVLDEHLRSLSAVKGQIDRLAAQAAAKNARQQQRSRVKQAARAAAGAKAKARPLRSPFRIQN